MKILLFGKNGQVGWELQRSLALLGEVIASDVNGPNSVDLCDASSIATLIRRVSPNIIVNAAGYTAVDRAEAEPALAHAINAGAPAVMATEAAKLNAWLVHYSTDYIFDGSGATPWVETSATGPLSVYGKTKLDGEIAVAKWHQHIIMRTSWVYATRGDNFAKKILKLAQERDALKIISDQIGAPTSAELLADATALTLRALQTKAELAGTYHVAASGETNWHAYAQHVIEHARQAGIAIRVDPENIAAVPSSAFLTPAQRPLNSRMDTAKFQTVFGLHIPDWRIGVDRMLSEHLLLKN